MPSLGLLKIGAYLEEQGYNVKILDLAGCTNWKQKVLDFLEQENYDYVGITSTTPQIPLVYEMCEFIKENFLSNKVIVGGPHVTLSNASIKKGSNRSKKSFDTILNMFDHVITGYGELAIIKALEGNSPKLIDAEEDKSIFVTNEIYEKLPMPARHLIDIESYNATIDGNKSTSIISQLGCPFNCSFCCSRSDTYRRIRTRSIESVIKEIDYLYTKYKYTGFMFYDDEINVNNALFEKLLVNLIDYQKVNNIKLSFRGSSRVDLLTEKQAGLMYEAGFKWLLLGFESGSDKILHSMNKNTTVEQNTKAFEIARKANLKVKALMSLGHPGESKETIEETKNWLKKVKPDQTDISIITLYPGSTYFDLSVWDNNKWVYTAKNNEILFSEDIDYLKTSLYYKSKPDEFICHVSTPFLSAVDLINGRNYIERSIK
jgi:radical SAM superfamily enzyme YgiQ (UPF0313 family)